MSGMVCLWSEGFPSFLCATVRCSQFWENFQCVDLTLCMREEGGHASWNDDLNVILFEFLDDDTKLAQLCRNLLYVPHWYVVAPDPARRVTLAALVGLGKDCHKHTQDTPPRSLCWFVSRVASINLDETIGNPAAFLFCVGSTWLCLGLCCQTGPVFSFFTPSWRFVPLLLGSSSTSAVAAQGVLMLASSSCVGGWSMVSFGCHEAGRCKRMPCGSS